MHRSRGYKALLLALVILIAILGILLHVYGCEIKKIFLAGDVYSHIVSTATWVLSFCVLLGGIIVSFEFQKRRRDARYGYFINLETMLKRLREAICVQDEEPYKELYLTMSNDSDYGDARVDDTVKNPVTDHATRILDYFSSKDNIVPAGKSNKKRGEWDKAITTIRDSALEFEKSQTGLEVMAFSRDKDNEYKEGYKKFHTDLLKAIGTILKMISEEPK